MTAGLNSSCSSAQQPKETATNRYDRLTLSRCRQGGGIARLLLFAVYAHTLFTGTVAIAIIDAKHSAKAIDGRLKN